MINTGKFILNFYHYFGSRRERSSSYLCLNGKAYQQIKNNQTYKAQDFTPCEQETVNAGGFRRARDRHYNELIPTMKNPSFNNLLVVRQKEQRSQIIKKLEQLKRKI